MIEDGDFDRYWQGFFKGPSIKKVGILAPHDIAMREHLLKLRTKFLEKPKYLAIGCGRGTLEVSIMDYYDILFTDKSDFLIKELKKIYGEERVEVADVFDLKYPNDSFDVIVTEGLLEHFQDEDVQKAINEMARVTKRYLVIVTPCSLSYIYMKVKRTLIAQRKWIYGYETDFATFDPYIKRAGLKTVYEEPLGGKVAIKRYREKYKGILDGSEPEVDPWIINVSKKEVP